LRQQRTAQGRAPGRQTPPVIVSEPQTLVLQLRLQDAVLFAQYSMTLDCSPRSHPTRASTTKCNGITE
jgi:hypothetical protein